MGGYLRVDISLSCGSFRYIIVLCWFSSLFALVFLGA